MLLFALGGLLNEIIWQRMEKVPVVVLNVFFYLYTLVLFTISTLLSLLVWVVTIPFDRKLMIFHHFVSYWLYCYVLFNPLWSVRVTGRENIPLGASVFASNHQSAMDILVLYLIRQPFKWVAKKELFSIPYIGWILRLGRYVSIIRNDRNDAVRMINQCVFWLSKGVSIMIFPEGTRSADCRVGAFKPGVVHIAKRAGASMVPVCVTGSGDLLSSFLIRPRRVKVSIDILPAISSEDVQEGSITNLVSTLEERVRNRHRTINPDLYGDQG